MTGPTEFKPATRQTYSTLQQELLAHPLHAASQQRIKWNHLAYGLPNGAPLPVRDMTNLPLTGFSSVDEATEEAFYLGRFGQHACKKIMDSTTQGGLYGGICGLTIVLLTHKNALWNLCKLPYHLFFKRHHLISTLKKLSPLPIAGLLIGGMGTLMGSVVGFFQASTESQAELQQLIRRRSKLGSSVFDKFYRLSADPRTPRLDIGGSKPSGV